MHDKGNRYAPRQEKEQKKKKRKKSTRLARKQRP
jgi:hypothetical protein